MFHAPLRRSATLSGIHRSAEMISPRVSSATASAFAPGTLHTSIPSSRARAVSIVLVPAPARITSLSESAASSAAAPTRVLRTTSASKPGTAPGRSSPVSVGANSHSWPWPRSCSSCGCGNASANRIFMEVARSISCPFTKFERDCQRSSRNPASAETTSPTPKPSFQRIRESVDRDACIRRWLRTPRPPLP